jgi:hypothetical protein
MRRLLRLRDPQRVVLRAERHHGSRGSLQLGSLPAVRARQLFQLVGLALDCLALGIELADSLPEAIQRRSVFSERPHIRAA